MERPTRRRRIRLPDAIPNRAPCSAPAVALPHPGGRTYTADFDGDAYAAAASERETKAMRALGARSLRISRSPFAEARGRLRGARLARADPHSELRLAHPKKLRSVVREVSCAREAALPPTEAPRRVIACAEIARESVRGESIDALVVPTHPTSRQWRKSAPEPTRVNSRLGTIPFANLLDRAAIAIRPVPRRWPAYRRELLTPDGSDHELAQLERLPNAKSADAGNYRDRGRRGCRACRPAPRPAAEDRMAGCRRAHARHAVES